MTTKDAVSTSPEISGNFGTAVMSTPVKRMQDTDFIKFLADAGVPVEAFVFKMTGQFWRIHEDGVSAMREGDWKVQPFEDFMNISKAYLQLEEPKHDGP